MAGADGITGQGGVNACFLSMSVNHLKTINKPCQIVGLTAIIFHQNFIKFYLICAFVNELLINKVYPYKDKQPSV